jgi:predicted nucleic acid-binding protein
VSYLIDSDICSAHLKQHVNVNKFVLQYAGRLHISTISMGELLTWGLRREASSIRKAGLRDFLKGVEILPVTIAIAEEFGRLRAKLFDAGHPTPEMDLWIAATAIHHNLTLVTHNTRHFSHIQGLTLEDWLTR